MRAVFLATALLAAAFARPAAGASLPPAAGPGTPAPVCLTANDLSIATGTPTLAAMPGGGAMQVPVWSLSGRTAGQSVAGLAMLPADWAAVKVEIVVMTADAGTGPGFEDVFSVHLSPMADGAPASSRYHQAAPVRTALPARPFHTRTILLEPYCKVLPGAPLWLRIQREPDDPADTFVKPAGLVMVKISPVPVPAQAHVVEEAPGYNSWPMLQALGDRLVCVYSRGKGHTVGEDARAVYARTSADGGKTWTAETVVADTPHYGEVPVGKGLDASGAMLLWVRRVGREWLHDLYRTTDGIAFTRVATPELAVRPIQITDIFEVPAAGLMALWFGGSYGEGSDNVWGTLTSRDNGLTWTQTPVESGLPKDQWPTEPAAVHLGEGRILAIARTELRPHSTRRAQFQMTSTDSGKTWKRAPTNITDVTASTPSLLYDPETGLLSTYYYHRGRGILRRRTAAPGQVFDHPLKWPASEAVAVGSQVTLDAGNVNATAAQGMHCLSFYSGKAPQTSVLITTVPASPRPVTEN